MGTLIQLAQDKGYHNVVSYLKALQSKKWTGIYDETNEENTTEKEQKKDNNREGKKKKPKAKPED